MNPKARSADPKAPWSGVALLLGTYSLSAVLVVFLARTFDYEHAIVYRHLILVATAVLSVFSILLIVPRGTWSHFGPLAPAGGEGRRSSRNARLER